MRFTASGLRKLHRWTDQPLAGPVHTVDFALQCVDNQLAQGGASPHRFDFRAAQDVVGKIQSRTHGRCSRMCFAAQPYQVFRAS
jgi:hypothetical protein